MNVEWGTVISGACESCVFGDTRLAMNCPKMRDVFYKYFRDSEEIWLKKCMGYEPIADASENNVNTYAGELHITVGNPDS